MLRWDCFYICVPGEKRLTLAPARQKKQKQKKTKEAFTKPGFAACDACTCSPLRRNWRNVDSLEIANERHSNIAHKWPIFRLTYPPKIGKRSCRLTGSYHRATYVSDRDFIVNLATTNVWRACPTLEQTEERNQCRRLTASYPSGRLFRIPPREIPVSYHKSLPP